MAFLGIEDGFIGLNDKSSWILNKIGGYPDWMKVTEKFPCCPDCKSHLLLIMQLYCPLGDSCYHRTLYIFACKNKSCWSSPSSWMVLRSQIIDESRISTNKPSKDIEKMFETEDDWGVNDNDWGDEKEEDWEIKKETEWVTSDAAAESGAEIHPSNNIHLQEKNEQGRDCAYEHTENQEKMEGNEGVLEEKLSAGIVNLNIEYDGTDTRSHAGQTCECLVAHYVNVIEEPSWCETDDIHVRKLLSEYERTEGSVTSTLDDIDSGSSSGEKYEKDDIRHGDKVFHQFTKQVSVCPQQCIRYQWNGTPLYISTPTPDILNAGRIPCKHCGASSVFELQLMPALVNYLKLPDQSESAVEFGTVLVYTCKASCWSDSDTIRQETVVIQQDPDQHLFK